jgi:hypothetical protein
MAEISPSIGAWYRHENGSLFEVVAIDSADGTVEIQHFDGTIEELDAEAWKELGIGEAEAPEDWSGSVDVDEETLHELDDKPAQHYEDPLNYLDEQD